MYSMLFRYAVQTFNIIIEAMSGVLNWIQLILSQHQHRLNDLENECQILKQANEKLLSSAFDLEKEREWRQRENALKVQIAQLEATLRADVGEKGGILDRLSDERGGVSILFI